jgi:hypothetical protein
MVRIGAFVLIILVLGMWLGCGGKPASVQQTGLNLTFPHCGTFEASLWIDNDYVGSFTSEQPSLIDVKPGGHTLYAKSNMVQGDSFFCWTTSFNITSQKITFVRLDCTGHGCR